MPSAKGKPTDPKLKEKITEGIFMFIFVAHCVFLVC